MQTLTESRLKAALTTLASMTAESYLVGGAVRDALSGKPTSSDLDAAVNGDGFDLARRVAHALGPDATFVPLDPRRRTGRIVLKGDEGISFDISSFKGDTIHEDLRRRDFTINAIAVPVENYPDLGKERPIDPCGGESDLARKIVRACSKHAFEDDPLRVLRAFRFAAGLGFEIDKSTLALMPASLTKLAAVSPERIRDEIIALLSAESSFSSLKQMDRVGIFETLFPELVPMKGCGQNEYHHLDVWEHSLETVRTLEELSDMHIECFAPLREQVRAYLSEEPVRDRPRTALLKLAALLHDSGKPRSRFVDPTGRVRFFGHEKESEDIFLEVGSRLRLATREIDTVAHWIRGHMRPFALVNTPVSRRAIFRLYREYGEDLIGLFLLYLADLAASRGPARPDGLEETTCVQIGKALALALEFEDKPPQPLVNGKDVMRFLGIPPGPRLGVILKKVAELQASGEVRTTEEALAAARDFFMRDQ